jgi:hypothetical protein
MGWMTGDIGVQFMAGTEISSLPYPDQLWDPPKLLSNECSGHRMKLITYLHLVLRLRVNGVVPLLPHMSLVCYD